MDSTQNPLDDELARSGRSATVTVAAAAMASLAAISGLVLSVAHGTTGLRWVAAILAVVVGVASLTTMILAGRRLDRLTASRARFEHEGTR